MSLHAKKKMIMKCKNIKKKGENVDVSIIRLNIAIIFPLVSQSNWFVLGSRRFILLFMVFSLSKELFHCVMQNDDWNLYFNINRKRDDEYMYGETIDVKVACNKAKMKWMVVNSIQNSDLLILRHCCFLFTVWWMMKTTQKWV